MGAIDALGRLGLLTTVWHCALVTVVWMESVVHVAAELAWAMKPRPGANEDISAEPFRPVVSRRSTIVRRGVVAVGTFGGDTDTDADLSFCFGSCETSCRNCGQH